MQQVTCRSRAGRGPRRSGPERRSAPSLEARRPARYSDPAGRRRRGDRPMTDLDEPADENPYAAPAVVDAATEVYGIDSLRLGLGVYWRLSRGNVPGFLIAAACKLLGVRLRFPVGIPAIERLELVDPEALPPHVRAGLGPLVAACEAEGLRVPVRLPDPAGRRHRGRRRPGLPVGRPADQGARLLLAGPAGRHHPRGGPALARQRAGRRPGPLDGRRGPVCSRRPGTSRTWSSAATRPRRSPPTAAAWPPRPSRPSPSSRRPCRPCSSAASRSRSPTPSSAGSIAP